MITLGIVREIEYISTYLKIPVELTFHLYYSLDIKIDKKVIELKYNNIPIWTEDISEDGFFGIESCDSISRIINCINNGQDFSQYVLT